MAVTSTYKPTDNGIHVLIGKYEITNIESIDVMRSIETIPSNFTITLTLSLPDGTTSALDMLNTLDKVTIWSNQTIIHHGVLERKPRRVNSQSLEVAISGRSTIRNIFDCAAQNPGLNITATGLIDLMQQVCTPLRIEGNIIDRRPDSATEQSLTGFNLNMGENVWPVISRAASYEGVIVYDSPQGDFIVSSVNTSSSPVSTLDSNAPILDMDLVEDDSERFATYQVVLQPVSMSSETFDAPVQGIAYDDEIKKLDPYRTKQIINATMNAQGTYSQTLANWTRNRAWARSKVLSVTVAGHTYAPGKIWDVEQMVKIDLPKLNLKDTWIITDATYHYSRDAGEITALRLMHPLGLTPEPIVIAGGVAAVELPNSSANN